MEKNRVLILSAVIIMALAAFCTLFFINNKFQVKFDCGKNCKTQIKYVKKGEKVKAPKTPKKEGKVFIEWQLDGKKYNFNTEVNKNMTLKAKWLPEIYVNVSFVTDNNIYDNFNILAGNTIEKYAKEPTKEGYKFLGWYINDKEYNFNKKVTSDITLVAKWEEEINNDTVLEVGDEVIITGNYAASSYSNYAIHSAAIGWKRKIVAIYNNANYPYAVGDSTGITGYFSIDSIKKAN